MFLTVCLSSVSSTWAIPTASFQGLGDLPGGNFNSRANGVSADGGVVVGRGWSSTGFEAFLWTEAGGMIGLGDLPGGALISSAIRVSADGSAVVGLGESSLGGEAFCWTAANGIFGLGDLPGGVDSSIAFAASADGLVVVGNSASASGSNEAFRWTETGGMVGLGDLPGGIFKSAAHDVSADGSVVVGRGNSSMGEEAYRWTQSDGMVGLGFLTTVSPFSQANAVTPDGLIVVGESHSDLVISGNEAFRWTSETGMVGLGSLPAASNNRALAVSVNGVVIVGESTFSTGTQAFIWDVTLGIRNLQDVMVNDFGLNLTGWTLLSATGISDDGQTIVGVGINPSGDNEAWIAFLPLPDADGDGIPDNIDVCQSTPIGEPIDTVGCGCVTEDTSKPIVICPADRSLSADPGACTASNVNLVMPATSDNCGVASVTHDAPVAFSVGDTIVTWTVTDMSGNTETCQQRVTVTDDEAPTLVCSEAAGLPTDTGACIASSVNLVSPTTSDNCGVASVTNDAPMTLPTGDTMVNWTVTDMSGNVSSCQQTVTVTDEEPPVITVCP
ncbi:MAG: HYR domain-containing protein, partial [Phycisphaerae bacterium]